MKKVIHWSISILICTGCGPRGEEPEQAPPATAVAPIAGVPLDTALALLHTELSVALDDELNDIGLVRFQRAEALTDRLLETRFPVRWLKEESYSVESRLRQIQALADRITAEIRSNAPKDSALADLRLIREEVTSLRTALRAGSGTPPPPLDRLLAGERDTTPVPTPGTTSPPAEPDDADGGDGVP